MRSMNETLDADGTVIERRWFVDGVEGTQAEFDAYAPPMTPSELTAEVRGIKERTAGLDVSNADAQKVRDAVSGRAG